MSQKPVMGSYLFLLFLFLMYCDKKEPPSINTKPPATIRPVQRSQFQDPLTPEEPRTPEEPEEPETP